MCIEADGSMQLEMVSIACCEPVPLHDLHSALEEQAGQEDSCDGEASECGGCSDQILDVIEVPKGKQTPPPMLASLQVSTVMWGQSDEFEHMLRAPRPPEHRLTCLKSVVLRC